MDIRTLIDDARRQGRLQTIQQPVSRRLEAAGLIRRHDPAPILLQDVQGWRVASNLITGRKVFADYLGLDGNNFLASLAQRLTTPAVVSQTAAAPCQEIVDEQPDFNRLPILLHYPSDGGPYITSGVWVVRDPVLGRNLSYHRLMVAGERTGTVRVVEKRGMDLALKHGAIEVAICIGPALNSLLAAALSPPPEVDEYDLAARLAPLQLVKCKTVDLEVPAESELIIEGRFTGDTAAEGPFVDITGTIDFVRQQPVFAITAVTTRRQPIYHALAPAGSEHQALMGLPKEFDIFMAVRAVCDCRDVVVTPGGCSWLHAVIVVRKEHGSDARRAIEAAFTAHRSLKHCVVVDDDIDPHDPQQVEWAVATRFQADRDLIVLADQPSSSLDPSARHQPGKKSIGSKMGLDATIKAGNAAQASLFKRIDREAHR